MLDSLSKVLAGATLLAVIICIILVLYTDIDKKTLIYVLTAAVFVNQLSWGSAVMVLSNKSSPGLVTSVSPDQA